VFQKLFAVGGFPADGDGQVVFRLLLVKLCSLLLNMRSDQGFERLFRRHLCLSDEPLDFSQVPAQDGDIQVSAMPFDDVEARKGAIRKGEGYLTQ
jgi:hypothetical protein